MKILIIEDEILLANSIQALLESKGFDTEAVYDGETGAEYAALGIYDLLILDVMMPKMDGYQVARTVRAKRCSTPILMLTAKSELEDRIEAVRRLGYHMKYSAAPAAVQVELERSGLHCLLSVSNPGEPIAPEELKNIFKRFYRIDKVRSMNRGYGLGLSIAESVVKEHRGRIWAGFCSP